MLFGIGLGTGAFLILMGFLVKKYPDLIAGYNTMSEKQKAKVNIDGLSSMMKNAFIILGVLVALAYPLMSLLVLKEHVIGAIITIVLLGTFIMVIYAQKFNVPKSERGKKRKNKFVLIGIGFTIVAFMVFGLIYYGLGTPEVNISNKQISISGMYSISEEVESIEKVDTIPKILAKTNGFNYGSTLKGNFRVEELGKVRLYLSSRAAPFILIKTKEGSPIYINAKTESETSLLLEKLNSAFKE